MSGLALAWLASRLYGWQSQSVHWSRLMAVDSCWNLLVWLYWSFSSCLCSVTGIVSICLCFYFSGQCKSQGGLPRPPALFLPAQCFGDGPCHPAGGILSLQCPLPFSLLITNGPAGTRATHPHHLSLRDPGRSSLPGLCLPGLWLWHHQESSHHTCGQCHCQVPWCFPKHALLPEAASEWWLWAEPGGGTAAGIQVHQCSAEGRACRPGPGPL